MWTSSSRQQAEEELIKRAREKRKRLRASLHVTIQKVLNEHQSLCMDDETDRAVLLEALVDACAGKI